MLESDDLCQRRYASNDRLCPAPHAIATRHVLRLKSIVDDFNERGYCKRESKLVLRSAEIQPLFLDFVHRAHTAAATHAAAAMLMYCETPYTHIDLFSPAFRCCTP